MWKPSEDPAPGGVELVGPVVAKDFLEHRHDDPEEGVEHLGLHPQAEVVDALDFDQADRVSIAPGAIQQCSRVTAIISPRTRPAVSRTNSGSISGFSANRR